MKILVVNGSPRKNGTVAAILKLVVQGFSGNPEIEYINVYDLNMKPCMACMKCRPDGRCILPPDDSHITGEKIVSSDAVIIGTPVHWGNMSSQLKILFDRNVPLLMGESPLGIPVPRHKGKPAVIVTACTTPWPFNFIAAESRGAIRAVSEILHYSGFKISGKIVKPGTKSNLVISSGVKKKAARLGAKLETRAKFYINKYKGNNNES